MPDEDRPDWWRRNQALRERLELPAYEPPRFADGRYTHEVVPELERRFGCRIRFVGFDTEYPEDWCVEVDGRSVLPIGHRRDENGNTVYEMSAAAFERALDERLG